MARIPLVNKSAFLKKNTPLSPPENINLSLHKSKKTKHIKALRKITIFQNPVKL